MPTDSSVATITHQVQFHIILFGVEDCYNWLVSGEYVLSINNYYFHYA